MATVLDIGSTLIRLEAQLECYSIQRQIYPALISRLMEWHCSHEAIEGISIDLAEPVVPESNKGAPESLTVTCPTCHERMGMRLEDQPQTIKCTYCGAKVSVPSREQAREHQVSTTSRFPAPVADEYAVAAPTDGRVPAARSGRGTAPNATKRASGQSAAQVVSLECPTCHELVKARVGPAAGKVPCTFCGLMLSVPDQKTFAARQAQKVGPRKPEEIGDYAAGAPIVRPPVRAGTVFDRLAEIRREVAPPPPKWTFFSGVFAFPWRMDVLLRWGYMSVGFTALLMIGLVLRSIAAGFSGMASGVAAAFFLLPIIWVTIWSLSYAAACGSCVLEATAAGLDRIEAWPDPNWRDWMGQMIYLGWIGAIPLAASYGISLLAGQAGMDRSLAGWTMTAAFFVLYPIALMSALEANSIWVPLTLPILVSLVRWGWAWLMFYLLSGLIAAGLLAAFGYALGSGLDAIIIALGPLVAAGVLVYFRLLGRLAWRMTAK